MDTIVSNFFNIEDKNLPYQNSDELFSDCQKCLDFLCCIRSEYMELEEITYFSDYLPLAAEKFEYALYEKISPNTERKLNQDSIEASDYLFSRIRRTIELNIDIPFLHVIEEYRLTNFEAFMLFLAIAPDLNRKYEMIFSKFNVNRNQYRATLGLCADLYSMFTKLNHNDLCNYMDYNLPINALLLERTEEVANASYLSRPLKPRKDVLIYILGLPEMATGELSDLYRVIEPCEEEVLLHQAQIDECKANIQKSFQKDNLCHLIYLYGQPGVGRKFVASKCNVSLLYINTSSVKDIPHDDYVAIFEQIATISTLRHHIPYIEFEEKPDSESVELLKVMGKHVPSIIVAAENMLDVSMIPSFKVIPIEVTYPNEPEQVLLWQYFMNKSNITFEDTSIEEMVCFNHFKPQQICYLTETLKRKKAEGNKITKKLLKELVISETIIKLKDTAEYVPVNIKTEDLVLPRSQHDTIKFIFDSIKQRYNILYTQGFGKKLPYGKGISILLYGPPGTGKTMTAQIISSELGLSLFRVDTSKILDKYIGETQKKLGALFDTTADSNVILFFDEADALFSKRTEVSDSNDKYANAETSYLLQRMEQHPGITILATNYFQNFDAAFRRRITYMINIPIPDEKTRLQLWKKVFPEEIEVDEQVDFKELAHKFDFTGSDIKYVAMQAIASASIAGTKVDRAAIKKGLIYQYEKTAMITANIDYF